MRSRCRARNARQLRLLGAQGPRRRSPAAAQVEVAGKSAPESDKFDNANSAICRARRDEMQAITLHRALDGGLMTLTIAHFDGVGF